MSRVRPPHGAQSNWRSLGLPNAGKSRWGLLPWEERSCLWRAWSAWYVRARVDATKGKVGSLIARISARSIATFGTGFAWRLGGSKNGMSSEWSATCTRVKLAMPHVGWPSEPTTSYSVRCKWLSCASHRTLQVQSGDIEVGRATRILRKRESSVMWLRSRWVERSLEGEMFWREVEMEG